MKLHKIYHSVLNSSSTSWNNWNKPNLSTFSELKSQEVPVDYTQASKMNKITGSNDRKH